MAATDHPCDGTCLSAASSRRVWRDLSSSENDEEEEEEDVVVVEDVDDVVADDARNRK